MSTLPSNPAVSVIVPCYNVEACLARALNSVLAQTFWDYCIYAVDDGSTDGTLRVLQKYPNCRALRIASRSGAAAARNHAIRTSNSPYIAFLDADDEWIPEKLDRQMAVLEKDRDLGMVCSFCRSGEEPYDELPGENRMEPLSGKLFARLVRECFVFTPTVVLRRECLKDAGMFNESLTVSEDFNLWLRIAARWKIKHAPEILAIRHRRAEGLSFSTGIDEMQQQGIAALEHIEQSCPGLSFEERRALRRVLAERNYCYGSHLLAKGASSEARRRFDAALELDPSHWRALTKRSFSFLPAGAFRSFSQWKSKRDLQPAHGHSTKA